MARIVTGASIGTMSSVTLMVVEALRVDLAELVVFDDVAGAALLGEPVLDEGLRLEDERVVDRRRHEEDPAVDAPATVGTLADALTDGEVERGAPQRNTGDAVV